MSAGTLEPRPILPPGPSTLFSRMATLPMLRRVGSAWMWTSPPDAASLVRTRFRYDEHHPCSIRLHAGRVRRLAGGGAQRDDRRRRWMVKMSGPPQVVVSLSKRAWTPSSEACLRSPAARSLRTYAIKQTLSAR